MKVRVIDFETTEDPHTGDNHICELGYCDLDLHNLTVAMPKNLMVNPGRNIAPQSSAIHHITDVMCADGLREEGVDQILMNGMGVGDFFAAHQVEYERSFFSGYGHQWICTRKVAYDLYPDAPSHALQTLRYYLDLNTYMTAPSSSYPSHRAGPDSYLTACLLQKMFDHTVPICVANMVSITERPLLLRTVPFTREHKGKSFEEVDDGLLRWFLDLPDCSEDLRYTCQTHLEMRRKDRSNPFGS